MTTRQTIGDAIDLAKDNPYTGTSEQIINLSISIAETFKNILVFMYYVPSKQKRSLQGQRARSYLHQCQ